MIVILENTQLTLKKGRDIFGILFIWWKGLFWNIIKERVSFAKGLERVEWLLIKMEGREGPKGKSALLPPLSRTE